MGRRNLRYMDLINFRRENSKISREKEFQV
jgi:hypothetical protein